MGELGAGPQDARHLITTRRGHLDIIEWFDSFYRLLFVLSLPLLFVGWMLSALARAGAFMHVLVWFGFSDRRKRIALAEHPEVCAACLYPVVEAEQCPECGSTYNQPGAVLSRGDDVSRVPAWLRVLTVAPVVLIAAMVLLHFGGIVGNKWYWGAYEVAHRYLLADYVPQQGLGSPGYEIQINASLVIDADPNAPQPTPPLDGYVCVVLNNVTPRPSTTVRIQVRNQSWEMLVYPAPLGSGPPSTITGSGLSNAVDATFREAQLDGFWQNSAAELDDTLEFARLILDGEYDEFEAASGLPTTGRGLQFSAVHRGRILARQHANTVFRSQPDNWVSQTLTWLAVAMPLAMLAGYTVWRVVIRRLLKR